MGGRRLTRLWISKAFVRRLLGCGRRWPWRRPHARNAGGPTAASDSTTPSVPTGVDSAAETRFCVRVEGEAQLAGAAGACGRSGDTFLRAPLISTGINSGINLSASESRSAPSAPLCTAESRRVQPDPSGWGPGGRRFKACLPGLRKDLLLQAFSASEADAWAPTGSIWGPIVLHDSVEKAPPRSPPRPPLRSERACRPLLTTRPNTLRINASKRPTGSARCAAGTSWSRRTRRGRPTSTDTARSFATEARTPHQALAKIRPLAGGRRLRAFLSTGTYRDELPNARWIP